MTPSHTHDDQNEASEESSSQPKEVDVNEDEARSADMIDTSASESGPESSEEPRSSDLIKAGQGTVGNEDLVGAVPGQLKTLSTDTRDGPSRTTDQAQPTLAKTTEVSVDSHGIDQVAATEQPKVGVSSPSAAETKTDNILDTSLSANKSASSKPNRYAYLTSYFHDVHGNDDSFQMTFDGIDQQVRSNGGILPKSSRKFRSWWTNSQRSPQARAWLDAGFRVARVDLDKGRVAFQRDWPETTDGSRGHDPNRSHISNDESRGEDRPKGATVPRRRAKSSKYAPIAEYLKSQTTYPIQTTFSELERAIGLALPNSARNHLAWWSNSDTTPQGMAWRGAGFATTGVNLEDEAITFIPVLTTASVRSSDGESGESIDSSIVDKTDVRGSERRHEAVSAGDLSRPSPRKSRTSKYAPLANLLRKQTSFPYTVTFADIGQALGFELPPSATSHAAWWANSEATPQARIWDSVGLASSQVNIGAQTVTFVRKPEKKPKPLQATSRPVDTGTQDASSNLRDLLASQPKSEDRAATLPTRGRKPRTSKYQPLTNLLARQTTFPYQATFADIERALGFALPPSASKHATWWANSPLLPHSKVWYQLGLAVTAADLNARVVTFVRRAKIEKPVRQTDKQKAMIRHAESGTTVPGTGKTRTSKYAPLADFLSRQSSPYVASFDEIEKALGFPLPQSALGHAAWWANSDRSPQGRAWDSAGLAAKTPRLAQKTVTFVYKDESAAAARDKLPATSQAPVEAPDAPEPDVPRKTRTSKYAPLADFLSRQSPPYVASFDEIEKALGFPLPQSALGHAAWWANSDRSPQGRAWDSAGLAAKTPRLAQKTVTFVRKDESAEAARDELPATPQAPAEAPDAPEPDVSRKGRTSKYAPLADFLSRLSPPYVASFDEIEKALGFPLPQSALGHAAWWANSDRSPQGRAWDSAGLVAKTPRLAQKTVTFVRKDESTAAADVPRKGRTSKYAPLADFLNRRSLPYVAGFDEIEKALGFPLPQSALGHAAWWANTDATPQARIWTSLGLITKTLDLKAGTVVFERRPDKPSAPEILDVEESSSQLQEASAFIEDSAAVHDIPRKSRRSKYSPLVDFLGKTSVIPFRIGFGDIEKTLGFRLPKSAYEHASWWANSDSTPQARAWMGAGFTVNSLNLESRTINFDRASFDLEGVPKSSAPKTAKPEGARPQEEEFIDQEMREAADAGESSQDDIRNAPFYPKKPTQIQKLFAILFSQNLDVD